MSKATTDSPDRELSKVEVPTAGFRFSGVGGYLPKQVVTNDDLAKNMETSDQWIRERTGIFQRHVGETTTEMAVKAGRIALDRAGLEPGDIDQLLLATTTPEYIAPGSSPVVAHQLGLECGALDIQAVCSGWVYGLVAANGLLLQGMNRVMLIGSEMMDYITDYSQRDTGILFGNGAAAVIIERDLTGASQLLSFDLGSAGQHRSILYAEHGGVWQMEGKEVFRQAISVMQRSVRKALAQAGLGVEDIDLVIPHQANIRIVEAAWKRIGFSMDKTAMRLRETGNTSAASIPLVLDKALDEGRLHEGATVLFVGFGAGMTWGTVIVRWAGDPRTKASKPTQHPSGSNVRTENS